MKIDFNPSALVFTDVTDIYDVYFMIIDGDEKTIDCSDNTGMSIAYIHYEDCKECGYLPYSDDGKLTGDVVSFIKDGELIKEVLG